MLIRARNILEVGATKLLATTRGAAPTVPNPSINVRVILLLLMLFYLLNFIDRQIINILTDPISEELHLSDPKISVMTGLAFAALRAA